MKIKPILLIMLFLPVYMLAQPLAKQKKVDLSKDKVLYTIGYAHLDTEWLWDYPTTINEYIKNTMEENFLLFEKYPDYVFSFTGSRRYNMMKEYYPDLYQKVKEYVKKGQWHVSGSSVDEGEVNVSSSESLIRQVLYGNDYFQKEFGEVSSDYMLPDCFGFIANTPSIWNHCGLLGFSTQKLTWGTAIPTPFNVGVWNGPDGKGIIAALNATEYLGPVKTRFDKDSAWNARLDDNFKKTGLAFDYKYYGVGDMGGAPRENDVRHAVGSLNNPDSKFKVVLSSSDQMYKDITPDVRKKLPVYSGDLLLINHSAGSMTSQVYMKRLNRKNENLAQSAEQISSVASSLFGAEYPLKKMNSGWDLVLGSQFHDILPGTSIPEAYDYAWNDEFIAANSFSESLKNGLSNVSAKLNTQVKGRAVVVYNPVAMNREDVVMAELEYAILPENIKVFAANGKEVLSQILTKKGNTVKFIFQAQIPSVGVAVFDVQETSDKPATNSKLLATQNSLENTFYKVTIASNGDITSIFDKTLSKELLLRPARLDFQTEKPAEWPSWNMDWNDRKNPPIDYLDGDATVKIIEQGSVRVALEITRKKRNSEITQIISLSAGNAGKRVEISNIINWQSTGVSLKASFPFVAENENATYNLGVGTIQRNTNHANKFEVPSKGWIDLTDKSGKFGVSLLEDCRYASDKPDNNTLRLTLLYTPTVGQGWEFAKHESSQDWGIQDVKYGIFSHSGNWNERETPWQSEFLNKPLVAFETSKHTGTIGNSLSFISFNSPKVGLMAFKKAENSDYFIVRVNELTGKDVTGIGAKFQAKIEDAYEVNGQEQKIGSASFSDETLKFDITHYTIKSYAVKFVPGPKTLNLQTPVDLPYNMDVVSFDRNRKDGGMTADEESYPAELYPADLTNEGIHFKMGSTEDEVNNVVSCKGQIISLPAGKFDKIYILAAATEDVSDNFLVGNQTTKLDIQNWTGYIGQFYKRVFASDGKTVNEVLPPFVKNSNIAWFASHKHQSYPTKNLAYKYCYLYKYALELPENATTLTLPKNEKIKIFAITVAQKTGDNIQFFQPLSDDFKENKPYIFTK